MLNSGQFITWYGLENGAEVYGYSTWRTFRNPVVNGEIMGTHKNSRGSYFPAVLSRFYLVSLRPLKWPKILLPKLLTENQPAPRSKRSALGWSLASSVRKSR
jgi:hypothetical protein